MRALARDRIFTGPPDFPVTRNRIRASLAIQKPPAIGNPQLARWIFPKEKPPPEIRRGFWVKTLAMTYSRMLDAHYHRRMYVSLPSSEWDRVVPYSYCHQGEGGGSRLGPVAEGSAVGLIALTLSKVGK